ncbi:hypothetical protein, partial [Myroides sp. LoEW2-1]|uniref:hypothetical protein n=1 Tax=Myroides sp. LoEW2-1 TaxID=2683192 RepID=UPI001322B4F1
MKNRNVLVLLFEYYLSAGKGIIIDILIPILIGIGSFILLFNNYLFYNQALIGTVITVLGIISGFGISSITLLLSSDRESVIKAKETKTNTVIDGEEISYFRRLYILICYSTVVSFIGVFFFFLGGLILWNKLNIPCVVNLMKSFSILYIT